jgi:uncharacterized membrane protein YphA (DoxX/SURF4 family)
MKSRKIAYWISTALLALVLFSGGVMDLMHGPQMVELMAHLGYPVYVVVLLGAWKVLGGVAVLAPKLPRLKEWAYAGVFFDLTGATISHAASGDDAGRIVVPLVLVAVALVSWGLRPESRTLGKILPESEAVFSTSARSA